MSAFPTRSGRAPVIALVAPKGGVGKTTLSTILMVAAMRAGLRPLGVNFDSQGSLVKWSRKRSLFRECNVKLVDLIEEATVLDLEPGRWREIVDVRGHGLVIVDTPPGHSDAVQSIRSMCGAADLVLVPTSSSQADVDEVRAYPRQLGAKSAFFVFNRTNRRARLFPIAQGKLVAHGKVCPIDIPASEVIPLQYAAGLTPLDPCNERSENMAASCGAFWEFVCSEVGVKLPELV